MSSHYVGFILACRAIQVLDQLRISNPPIFLIEFDILYC
ncbi:putative potassium-efflux system protein [Burkholderia pseudomallei MSHR1029]|uniref:Uncharacterized protein n=1 Tax=Burkholderia pseudomallei 1710a TaxID=320371 RepID=A0A0E1VYK0_BURPE|nr:potassium-efflux system protein [Burkholderia pseudomallei 305]EET05254.1 hypothetical protein BURPS1710A_A0834 [Burkholderia pseudomallei 1710a]KGW19375.1 putative potassium-efflux system protein [Burkholderia pseudomallei MSHR4303]KGW63039.1 putative potassium-efflux system protein [Burkholderia pseudomallei MSHR1029]